MLLIACVVYMYMHSGCPNQEFEISSLQKEGKCQPVLIGNFLNVQRESVSICTGSPQLKIITESGTSIIKQCGR